MKLFDPGLPFFKGNTHMHTTLSDGRMTPEEACAEYAAHGYDFIVLTDHRRVGPTYRHGGMLVMSGAEYDYTFENEVLHVVAVLPDEGMADVNCRQVPHGALIERINAGGGAMILAHPAWSLNTTTFMLSLDGICAAEIFNTFSDRPWNAPRADSSLPLDVLACAGRPLPLVAADDSHRYAGEQCRSYTMVQAETCEPKAIIAALKAGKFYASQGPRFEDVEVLEDRLIVHTSPVSIITFLSNLPWVGGRCRTGEGMTGSEYIIERKRGEKWVRVEIEDAEGRKAWLSPVTLGMDLPTESPSFLAMGQSPSLIF